MNRNITKIAALVFAAFAVVIVYQTYLQIFESHFLLSHPRNRRLQLLEQAVTRGRIVDNDGRILAETKVSGDEKKRVYPYGEASANITGYISTRYRSAGLESSYNEALLGLNSSFGGDDFWSLQKYTRGQQGYDLVLSLDAKLQQLAYNMLGSRKGAVVAIEPSTGRVLAMVSRPGFDPAKVEAQWESLKNNQQSPLLNRAAQGLYPPGSTMKIVTAAGILSINPDAVNRTFDAPGYALIEGRRIEDAQAKGRLSFGQALARSSNYVFTTLGIEQGAKVFVEMAHSFGIGEKIPFDLPAEEGSLPNPQSLSKLELAESAIGQGRIMATPLNMCLVAGGVANGGKIMAPSLVDEVRSPGGSVIRSFKAQTILTPVNAALANTLTSLMEEVVATGTGREAAITGVRVSGKTGSAENPHGLPHAWFIGFAPSEEPQVAVAVIIENGGAGGKAAAPIAREVMKYVIGRKR